MFKRPSPTYDFDVSAVEPISRDEANPLNRISHLIPDGSKVLDVGAGNGLLVHVLKGTGKELTVDGIEPDPYACEIARSSYRHFYCGYAQDFMDEIVGEDYDFIVLADVVEHMANPLEFLETLSARTSAKTRFLLSVPNVAFGAIRLALTCGRFDYVDSGILEKTHLRFFTRSTLERMIKGAGLYPEKLYFLRRDLFFTETDIDILNYSPMTLRHICRDELSSVYQFLAVLTKEETGCEYRHFGPKMSFPLLRWLKRRIRRQWA